MGMLISALFVNAQELKKSPFSANWTIISNSAYIKDFETSKIEGAGLKNINSLAFAEDGTMYIACNQGNLHSFKDGVLKKHDDVDFGILSKVVVDGKGRVWAASSSELKMLDTDGAVKSFVLCDDDKKYDSSDIPLELILGMTATDNGVYLSGIGFKKTINKKGKVKISKSGTTVVDFDGSSFQAINKPESNSDIGTKHNIVTNLMTTPNDGIVGVYTSKPALGGDELNYSFISIKDGKMSVFAANTMTDAQGSGAKKLLNKVGGEGDFSIYDMTVYKGDVIALSNDKKLFRFKDGKWEDYFSLSDYGSNLGSVRAIQSSGNSLWVSTTGAVLEFNDKENINFFGISKGYFAGEGKKVFDIFGDRSGKAWFIDGTPTNVMEKVTPPKDGYFNMAGGQISQLVAKPDFNMLAPQWTILEEGKEALELDAKSMKVDGELIQINEGVISKVVDGKPVEVLTIPGKAYQIKWTHTDDGSLLIYDKTNLFEYKKGQLVNLLEGQNPKVAKGFKGAWKLNDGAIWARAAKGLFVISADNTVEYFDKKNDGGFPSLKPGAVLQASNDVIYMKSGWTKNYKKVDGEWKSFESSGVDFVEGKNGAVYGASNYGIYDQDGNMIKYNDEKVDIRATYKGTNGNVWFIGIDDFYLYDGATLTKYDETNSTLRGNWIDAVVVKDGKTYMKCIIKDFNPVGVKVDQPIPVKKERFAFVDAETWAVFNASEAPVSVIEEEE